MNEKRVEASRRILEVAEEYSILWAKRELSEKGLTFYETVPTQDECLFLGIKKYGNKMSFDGTGSYFGGREKNRDLSPEELEKVLSELSDEHPSPEALTKCFTAALKKELAHYLASEELVDLVPRLNKACSLA